MNFSDLRIDADRVGIVYFVWPLLENIFEQALHDITGQLQYITIHYNTLQYNTLQYNTLQYIELRYSIEAPNKYLYCTTLFCTVLYKN